MVSIRNVLGAGLACAILLALTGCAPSPHAAANSIALTGLGEQLAKLRSSSKQVAGGNSSVQLALAELRAGDVGLVYGTPASTRSIRVAQSFTVITNARASGAAVRFDAVLQSSGESGGGLTGDQAAAFTCVAVRIPIPEADQKVTVSDASCPTAIAAQLRKRDGNSHVQLGQVPGSG